LNIVYQSNNGQIIHGDNIEVMKTIKENSVDSCISDFPYDLSFMGRKWDTTGNFYEWCKARAVELYRIMKPGGYVCIFGHPKTNHRMKCAFEDVGFNIVEEIDWVYLSGFPKNQDIGKMFDKKAGAERKVIGETKGVGKKSGNTYSKHGGFNSGVIPITIPATEQAKLWDGWKTSGLKPAHEPITIFQKPLEGTYIENIEKWNCGAMNIDACRVPINPEVDDPRLGGKGTWSTSKATENIYEGDYKGERVSSSELGRFPPNVIFDEYTKDILDEQTGISKSIGGKGEASKQWHNITSYGWKHPDVCEGMGGYGDIGGGSRMFPIIKYCPKVSPKERLLPNGERNPHVTLKPKELVKWLIKLVTPKDGTTIDITAGSCTHAVAVEELNRDEGYNLKYIDIELMNTETEPYCDVGKMRVESIVKNMS